MEGRKGRKEEKKRSRTDIHNPPRETDIPHQVTV